MKLNLFAMFAVALVSVEAIQIERTYQFAELNSEVEEKVETGPTANTPASYPTNSGITNAAIRE